MVCSIHIPKLCTLTYIRFDADSQGLNSNNQFRAGLYREVNTPISPPAIGPKLKAQFLSHLTPEKKPSPFISTFENFLPALHRALKSGKDAYISIIDLQQVEKDSRKRLPNAAEVIWPVQRPDISFYIHIYSLTYPRSKNLSSATNSRSETTTKATSG